ncbi:MAG: hypothetical protein E6K10_06225 [Methanobacteriota archaeon]|nr:MAG: hypothetical protein E6K10_06225 [Euryarchaeota archaeon]
MACRRAPLIALLLAGAFVFAAGLTRGTDTTPPRALDWGPRGADVPTDTQILIAWSERMNGSSVELAFSYSDGLATYTAGGWTHDGALNTSVFSPAAAFAPGTRYTVRVESTARDLAGNRLDQNNDGIGGGACSGPVSSWDCLVWTFDTAPLPPDTTPPRVLSTWPGDGEIAATNAAIRIVFSETMDTASVETAFGYSDGFSFYWLSDGITSWTSTNVTDDTLRFAPRLEFASGGRITAYVDAGWARDTAGNPLDGNGDGVGGDGYTWAFSIVSDPRPPTVLATAPLNGATGVSVSLTIRVVFSKSMLVANVGQAIRILGPADENLTISDGEAVWTGIRFPDDTLEFDPHPNLRPATPYEFVLQSDLARDRGSLPIDGDGNGTWDGSPADDFRLAFQTEAQDLTPPVVTDRRPQDGASDVFPGTDLRVVFDEPMNRTSVETAFSYTDGTGRFGTGDGTVWWQIADTVFEFIPASALGYGLRYTASLDGVIAEDTAGNPLNGGRNETWTFTTAGTPDATPPRVLWSSPFDGQRNVSRTARISFIFSEAMDKASVQGAMGITQGATLTDFQWPNDATVEAGTTAPMGWRAAYTVFVLTGAKDLAGNPLQSTRSIGFTTESWRGPVTGRVVDDGGRGIGGARVQLNGFSLLTNDTGSFAFEGIEQGTYTIIVTEAGYATFTETVVIEPEQPALPPVTLHRSGVAPVDAAVWAAAGATLLSVLLVLVFLRRRRAKPAAHYETWKPAKVVTVEPGQVRSRERP